MSKKKISILFASILTTVCLNVSAQTPSAEIRILNVGTREVKTYDVGSSRFDIPLAAVPGWSKCTVLPIKTFLFLQEQRMRVEIYCFNSQAGVVRASCSTSKGSIDVGLVDLFSPGTKVRDNDIDTPGGIEIALSCKYF